MDPAFGKEGESILPCKKDSSGALKSPVHLSGAAMRRVGAYVRSLAVMGAKQAAEGKIAPEPLEHECMYCDYRGICAWSGTVDEVRPAKRDPADPADFDPAHPREGLAVCDTEE